MITVIIVAIMGIITITCGRHAHPVLRSCFAGVDAACSDGLFPVEATYPLVSLRTFWKTPPVAGDCCHAVLRETAKDGVPLEIQDSQQGPCSHIVYT